MVLDEMEFLDLIKWKQDANKRPTIDEDRQAHGQRQASSGLVLAERDSPAASVGSLDDQVRQLLERAVQKAN